MNEKERLKNQFDEVAFNYDEQRKRLIPCFDDFYGIASSLATVKTNFPKILDIGAGTGLFSSFVLQNIPNGNAELTLIDLSTKMIDISKLRFANQKNMEYITADYTKYEFNKTFDIIISSLSIHHLTDDEKQELYGKIYSLLNDGGVFINADQVVGPTEYLEKLYKNNWKIKVEQSDLSKDAIQAAYERTKLDKMATLEVQLEWLKSIGFQEVDCVYKHFSFVVLYAKKV